MTGTLLAEWTSFLGKTAFFGPLVLPLAGNAFGTLDGAAELDAAELEAEELDAAELDAAELEAAELDESETPEDPYLLSAADEEELAAELEAALEALLESAALEY